MEHPQTKKPKNLDVLVHVEIVHPGTCTKKEPNKTKSEFSQQNGRIIGIDVQDGVEINYWYGELSCLWRAGLFVKELVLKSWFGFRWSVGGRAQPCRNFVSVQNADCPAAADILRDLRPRSGFECATKHVSLHIVFLRWLPRRQGLRKSRREGAFRFIRPFAFYLWCGCARQNRGSSHGICGETNGAVTQ